jgi:ABC-2 type transport system ATP-binding protein
MKQRLALAAVLLKDPELLVLDEPANGLDPAGLKEVRDLLRDLADEGRTVFISSHLLHEVQLICDSVAIMSQGRCIAQGPVEEVLQVRGGNAFVVRAPKVREAKSALNRAGFPSTFRGDQSLRVVAPPADAGRITKALADAAIYLTELRPEEISLEAVFLELTGDQE